MAKHISVTGIVQGVGFRPFVYGLATQLNLRGWVCNTSGGVEIHVEGSSASLERFLRRLEADKPALARIDSVVVCTDDASGEFKSFDILPSIDRQEMFHPIPADIALCPECEHDLFDPRNRRYLYPFINCAHCGPRFTIIKNIPYDRSNTTMAEFGMCEQCSVEYKNPLDRRFRAQPIACPHCGPFVALREIHPQFSRSQLKISSIDCRTSAILKARRLLREGYILGVKGLGGFHLVCDASNTLTVEELRDRKGKIGKPFALMAADLNAVRAICMTSQDEEDLLTGRERPIMVLEKRLQVGQGYSVSRWVAPDLDTLGVMLPYTPLHHLLLNQTDPVLATEPAPPLLVMTSGNVADEPIATSDEEALLQLSSLVDAFLLHNREIHMRCDDSVVRVDHGRSQMNDEAGDTVHRPASAVYLRRSRGYAPYPVKLPFAMKPVLAIGAEWNNVFCLARDRSAFLSHYIGNMENVETYEAFEQGVRHLSQVFRVQPEVIAHDLYPNFFSTRYVRRSTLNARRVAVQHHHAHIASCMADNGLEDRQLIGLAFDGTGYGTDGAIWGGEALLASYRGFERFGHLEYLPLPGGDTAYRTPWSVACGYAHVFGLAVDDLPFLRNVDPDSLRSLRRQLDENINVPLTSSMGRLFDAVASLIGVRNETTYEAQAALEMEALARPFVPSVSAYPFRVEVSENETIVGVKDLLTTVISEVRAKKSSEIVAARFHRTVAEMAIELCRQARQATGLREVALSGGVWQNRILLDLVRSWLEREDFTVYFHKQVPTNDGGLALGQAVIANHS